MKQLILEDNHDLCIRTFLKEINQLKILREKKSVLHIGAHLGEEVIAYRDYFYSPIYLVEANPEVIPILTKSFERNEDIFVIPVAVGDSQGEAEFIVHRTRKGGMESSGLLNLEMLGDIVPVFDSELRYRVPMTTIDMLVKDHNLTETVGLLVIDIQGSEIMALSGAHVFLSKVDAVICEVNLISNYEGCGLEADIDLIFKAAGFTKQLAIYHELYDESSRFPAWGECLWYKQR
jgi:FkbM family methyltransferase